MQTEALQMAPHGSSEAQKQTRVATSRRFLDLLGSVQHQGWKYLVTLDEAWFYFSNQHQQIWLPYQEDPQRIQRQMINSPKTMLTVVWNPHGFHLVSSAERTEVDQPMLY
jgi:deoxycytidine triphosphate deaminase